MPNAHRMNVPGTGNSRRNVAKAVPVRWDAGESKCGTKVKAITAKRRAVMDAARPLPKVDSQADRIAIAAYLARIAK